MLVTRAASCDEMLISKYQACPNWVFSLGTPNFGPEASKRAPRDPSQYVLISDCQSESDLGLDYSHPLPSPPPTLHDVVWVFLVEHEGVVDPLLALFQAKPVISAGKFSHPKVQIMAGSVWAGYWPPSWPPQVGHLHTVQVATKLVIDVPANSKTPISHQSIQLINSRLFPLAGLCSQINKYWSPFLEGQCTEPLDELTERMTRGR